MQFGSALLLLTVDEDGLLVQRFAGAFQHGDEAVEARLELVEGEEAFDVEGEEEVPDVGRGRTPVGGLPFQVVHVSPVGRAGQDASQDVDHGRESEALVTAELFSSSTEGQDAAASARKQVAEDLAGVLAVEALLVSCPACRHLLPVAVVDLEFAAGHDARSGVQEEGQAGGRGGRRRRWGSCRGSPRHRSSG